MPQISQTIFSMPKATMTYHVRNFAVGIKNLNQEIRAEDSADIGRTLEVALASWPDDGERHVDAFGAFIVCATFEIVLGRAQRSFSWRVRTHDAQSFKML